MSSRVWHDPDVKMPPSMKKVMVKYEGKWTNIEGERGILDVYSYNGQWLNIPEGVRIVSWREIPRVWPFIEMVFPDHVSSIIISYAGFWKSIGNNGVKDVAILNGRLINIPPGIRISGWDYAHDIDSNPQQEDLMENEAPSTT